MGQGLPKAVTSVVVKRWGGTDQPFRVGLAEMNGWRPSMEDAHVVVMKSTWGFFGVFDGHGGDQCSAFVARRLTEELETAGAPEDDAGVTALALKLDREYLATGLPSGSTGTFVIITPPAETGGNYRLRVGNIGDSRVLLGRADGSMVEGQGSDGGLTTDHKPDHPDERNRIERTGGHVQEVAGVSRVNGDLAVSRAFGDAQYKETGGPAQEDHPVTAAPELTTLECSPSDFVVLVCDGISEGNFPNREVIRLAADELKKPGSGEAADPAAAATAVCRRALASGSKDNLSCMIVLLGGGELPGKTKELLPGAVDSLNNEMFRKAYEAMASHAGSSLVDAVEARYTTLQDLHRAGDSGEGFAELQQELAAFGDGPPKDLEVGSPERTAWFAKWIQEQGEQGSGTGTEVGALEQLMMQHPDVLELAQQRGLFPSSRQEQAEPVIAAAAEELRAAIDGHIALQWDERYLGVCGKEGRVLKRDNSDNTSQVRFHIGKPMTAWLPNETLRPPRARIADIEQLRAAVATCTHLEWDEDKHATIPGQECLVTKIDDSKETSLVRLPALADEMVWVPNSTLMRIDGGGDSPQQNKRPPG